MSKFKIGDLVKINTFANDVYRDCLFIVLKIEDNNDLSICVVCDPNNLWTYQYYDNQSSRGFELVSRSE